MQSISLKCRQCERCARLFAGRPGKLPIDGKKTAVDVGFKLGQCLNGIDIGSIQRGVEAQRSTVPASHAASVVPATIGGLSDTPVAPSITHALVQVAPMASSLTKALGDELEMRSIILNTTFYSNFAASSIGQAGKC